MNKDLRGSLLWAFGLIALGLGSTFARKLGYIGQDEVTRIVMGATGLMVAWYGNRMPKGFVADASVRKVTRIGGWSIALSGLAYAGLWIFAPLDRALLLGCAAVAGGIVITVVYSLVLRSHAKAA